MSSINEALPVSSGFLLLFSRLRLTKVHTEIADMFERPQRTPLTCKQ
jgi:hypothetical protein